MTLRRKEQRNMNNGEYRYSLKMSAPIGLRYGKLELNILGEAVDGFLTMFSKRLPIMNGSCRGSSLQFSGSMETLLSPFPYTAEGTVDEERVQIMFSTDKGCFPAEGVAGIQDDKEKKAP